MLYFHREETAQDHLQVGISPMASRSLPVANTGQLAYKHPSCSTVEETLCPFRGGQI